MDIQAPNPRPPARVFPDADSDAFPHPPLNLERFGVPTTAPPQRIFTPEPPIEENIEKAWWKEAVVYQIYPASFVDSNGDGIGDLNGITMKLDYLEELGVDVVWLSPIYKSPLKDMGYDISDYRDIDPRYGTLADWDRLVAGLHDRDMKIMMDLVVNHSSDEHEWFKESRSSKTNSKHDWYIWRPAKYDDDGNRSPPNNWKAQFEGSAWEWDETRQEYYLHLYLPGQPDLNWENPDVREAVYDMMKFWLDRGTDGFRMDVINKLSKVPGLPDAPVADATQKYQVATMHYVNGPRVHEFLKEMHEKVLSQYDTITVGEAPFSHSMADLARYVLPAERELNMVFQFELADIDHGGPNHNVALQYHQWTLPQLRTVTGKWQKFMRNEGFWNTVFIENHDLARSVSRFGNDSPQWRTLSAKMLAIYQVTLGGTLFIYQGQEIAMKNAPRSWGIEEYKDIATINYYARVMEQRKAEGKGDDMSDVMDSIQKKARDHARMPFQWNAEPNAGFTIGSHVQPWMRVNDDYPQWNLWNQMHDRGSVLNFWEKLLRLRKHHKVFTYGSFNPWKLRPDPSNQDKLFVYERCMAEHTILVILNFTPDPVGLQIAKSFPLNSRLLISNYPDTKPVLEDETLKLRGYEARIYKKWYNVEVRTPFVRKGGAGGVEIGTGGMEERVGRQ